jgi:archaellum component FlaC
VHDLLKNIQNQLDTSSAMIDELETSIKPSIKELEELQEKIKGMEYVEEMSQQVQPLKKKLAWSWVYEIDKQIQQQTARLEKLQARIPTCQAKIDKQQVFGPI